MKIAITGICGFVGSSVATELQEHLPGSEIFGMDNLLRPGSEMHRGGLSKRGIRVFHGDVRLASDVETLPAADWLIDAAANPAVMAGVDGKSSTRQLMEHNLLGTINLLEYCKRSQAGFLLLSTSRVYNIPGLAGLTMRESSDRYQLDPQSALPTGISNEGVSEAFSTGAPISLYGATKLASEALALEYGATFQLPVWVNRCGVLAGAGQFGTAEQGIFSYWLHAHAARRRLRYIGFNAKGFQVRDAFHPRDLARLLLLQIRKGMPESLAAMNAGGGAANAMSLAQLNAWCDGRFGAHTPEADPAPRPFDIPWMVMDSRLVHKTLGWKPEISIEAILEEIAQHVRANPDWLQRCLVG
jgi:CDP-paratose 2-epimerase